MNTDYIQSVLENVKCVDVSFNQNSDIGQYYTYKTNIDLEVGDLVVVPVGEKFKIGVVKEVDTDIPKKL